MININIKKINPIKKLVFISIFFLLISEILLRLTTGLGEPLLYLEDELIEYYIKPNQNIHFS